MVTYGTVKAAFAQLTRLLAVELAPSVRVNGIAPGVVETDGLKAVLNDELRARIISATPLHRLSTVADVANGAEGNTAATPTAFLPELRGRKEPTLTRENHFARHPVQPTGRGEGTGWLRVPGVS
jgi:NAD(P)-dependent dehydrogenase (short-subunit alcohol dehydrogenase family)